MKRRFCRFFATWLPFFTLTAIIRARRKILAKNWLFVRGAAARFYLSTLRGFRFFVFMFCVLWHSLFFVPFVPLPLLSFVFGISIILPLCCYLLFAFLCLLAYLLPCLLAYLLTCLLAYLLSNNNNDNNI